MFAHVHIKYAHVLVQTFAHMCTIIHASICAWENTTSRRAKLPVRSKTYARIHACILYTLLRLSRQTETLMANTHTHTHILPHTSTHTKHVSRVGLLEMLWLVPAMLDRLLWRSFCTVLLSNTATEVSASVQELNFVFQLRPVVLFKDEVIGKKKKKGSWPSAIIWNIFDMKLIIGDFLFTPKFSIWI